MAHAHRHHDYHLVDPSPWPLLSARSRAFVLALGGIAYMRYSAAIRLRLLPRPGLG